MLTAILFDTCANLLQDDDLKKKRGNVCMPVFMCKHACVSMSVYIHKTSSCFPAVFKWLIILRHNGSDEDMASPSIKNCITLS